MKRFLLNTGLFLAIFIVLIILVLAIPQPGFVKDGMLHGYILKDSLMTNVSQPRIIITGGSNVPYGINSQMIKDSLNVNPVNAGLHATLGLVFIANDVERNVRAGDVVIISPEYQQFYGDVAYGGEELMRLIFDVSYSNIKKLKWEQYKAFTNSLYPYLVSKVDLVTRTFLSGRDSNLSLVDLYYSVRGYNQYGDMEAHWDAIAKYRVQPIKSLDGQINMDVINCLRKAVDKMENKGATVFITYPGFQEASFNNCQSGVEKLADIFAKYEFRILGTPQRYIIPDSLIFDTPYHLSRAGVNLRTRLLIEDIKSARTKD